MGGWNVEGVRGMVLIRVDIIGETKLVAIIRTFCGRILKES